MKNLVIEKIKAGAGQTTEKKQEILSVSCFGRKASFESISWNNLDKTEFLLNLGKEVNCAFHENGSSMRYYLENEKNLINSGIINITENKRKNRVIAIATVELINENTLIITDFMVLGNVLRGCVVEAIETYVELLKIKYNVTVLFEKDLKRNGFVGIQKILAKMSTTKFHN